MANSINTSGTLTTTGSATEDVLATVTTAASLQLHLDLNALATGDTGRVLIYSKVLSGGTERILWEGGIGGDMYDIWVSPIIVNVHHAKFSIIQNNGSGRSIPWAVYQVG